MRARLCRLAILGDILASADHFHFRQREDALVAWQFDADEPGGLAQRWRCGRRRNRLCSLVLRGCILQRGVVLGRSSLHVVVRRNRTFEALIHLGFDAHSVSLVAKSVRLERACERDVQVGFDRVLQAQRPEATVHQQTPIAFVRDVFRRAVKRREHAAHFARGGFVSARPLGRLRRLRGIGGRLGGHAVQWLGHRENLAVDGFPHVGAHLHPNILHAAQNRMLILVLDDRDARALLVIRAVVTDPSLPKHLMTEAQFVAVHLAVEGVLGEGIILAGLEGVRRRAQSGDRSAAIEIRIDVLHLLLRELLEPQEHHHQVGGIERLHAWHVRIPGDDVARGRIDVEQHCTLESLMLRQQPRQSRQRLLRPILVIAREEDDVLALAGAIGALKDQRCGAHRGHRQRDER